MRDLSVPPLSGSRVLHPADSVSPFQQTSPGSPKEFGYLDQIERLRQSLHDSSRSIDSLLASVTETARVLTGADAAALALLQGGHIVCRARSGPLGPEIGDPVNTKSGISGECVRSSTTLISADTLQDARVDPDVCRELGIRSIAVVPLRRQSAVIGILEAFSGSPEIFDSDHLVWLQALAEIGEQIYDREQDPLPGVIPAASKRSQFLTAIVSHGQLGISLLKELFKKRDLRIIAATAVAVLLLSALLWTTVRRPRMQSAASDLRQSGAPIIKKGTAPTPKIVPRSPAARFNANRPNDTSADSLLHKAAELSPASDSQRMTAGESSDQGITLPHQTQALATPPVPDEPPPPVELVARSNAGAPLSTATISPALPPYAGPVSQITEAKLIRKVDPFYPAQARLQRLQGAVVLDATIAQDGTVRSTKIVSGIPALAQAASSAVRNWRYTAATLNGKPTEVVTRITIVFRLP